MGKLDPKGFRRKQINPLGMKEMQAFHYINIMKPLGSFTLTLNRNSGFYKNFILVRFIQTI